MLKLLQHYPLFNLLFIFLLSHFYPWWVFLSYPTQYQSNWATYPLHCWLQNQIKILIVLPKFKALLGGGPQLYTKMPISRAGYQARIDWVLYRINLVTWVTVDLKWVKAYLTTIYLPLKSDRSFNYITSTFCC